MFQSEAQTLSELIDQQLAQSGWNVKDLTQVIEEFDILIALPETVTEPRTTYESHQFSDNTPERLAIRVGGHCPRRLAVQQKICMVGFGANSPTLGSDPVKTAKSASRLWSGRTANCAKPMSSFARPVCILPRRSSSTAPSPDSFY